MHCSRKPGRWFERAPCNAYISFVGDDDDDDYYCLPCECGRDSKHITAVDMQSRPAVFMSARLVVASCAEMAAEADVGHFLQHTITTPHYRDALVVLGNENKNAASLVRSPLRTCGT